MDIHTEKTKNLLGPQIEDELMKYILGKPIAVGEKMPNEFELAEMFGVGRSTVREAVKGLVSRGVLEIRRGAGTYVISTVSSTNDPLGLNEYHDKFKMALDLFEVRLMIEPEIAALACKNATNAQIRTIRRLCDETEQLYRGGFNHIPKDIEFHTCIAACSNNKVVERLLPIIHSSVMTFANVTHRLLRQETIDTHRAIVEAIERRDTMGARCAMTMHLTYNRQSIIKMIEENNKETSRMTT